jgi:general nucleoside transport system permease protein
VSAPSTEAARAVTARPRGMAALRDRLPVLVTTALALGTALVLGGLVIVFSDPEVLDEWGSFFGDPLGALQASWDLVRHAYQALIDTSLGSPRVQGRTLVETTPLILGGLSVALAFRAGLFNIGGAGQLIMGATCANWVGFAFDLPMALHLPLAVAAGFAGGAVWGSIAGYLKARTGAHEVITTIMLNFVAIRLLDYALRTDTFRRSDRADPISKPVVESARLNELGGVDLMTEVPPVLLGLAAAALVWGLARRLGGPWARPALRAPAALVGGVAVWAITGPALRELADALDWDEMAVHRGLYVALGAAVVVWWLLDHSTTGFRMRAVGVNPDAARTAGMNVGRTYVLTMALAGGLAGLAGATNILGRPSFSLTGGYYAFLGFDAIAVALLGRANPGGVVAAAFLFGVLRAGSTGMQAETSTPVDIIVVIQALIIAFVAAPLLVRAIYRVKAAGTPEQAFSTRWGS